MKVLVAIFEELVPISGGGTPRISSVVRAFARRGHEVYVACSIDATREEAIAALQCRDVLPLPGVSRLDRRKMLKYLYTYPWNMAKLASYARKIQPDLIVSHNSVAGYGAVLSHSLGSKGLTVLDLTDVLFEYLEDYGSRGWLGIVGAIGRRMERDAFRRSDRIITISQAMADIIVGKGVRRERVDIVHDGVDIEIFHPLDGSPLRQRHASDAEHVLIYHGVIDPQDEPMLLMDAVGLILERFPRTAFWLVGSGAAVPSLQARVEKEGWRDRFLFSGWVSQEEVPLYISASDLGLVILPDVISARGRVTLKEFEYWGCGIPAILPRLPALEEVVPGGEASLFYQPGDAQDLARQTIALLEDQELRLRMGRRGMEMVKEKFQWPALADEFVALCEGFLERGLSA